MSQDRAVTLLTRNLAVSDDLVESAQIKKRVLGTICFSFHEAQFLPSAFQVWSSLSYSMDVAPRNLIRNPMIWSLFGIHNVLHTITRDCFLKYLNSIKLNDIYRDIVLLENPRIVLMLSWLLSWYRKTASLCKRSKPSRQLRKRFAEVRDLAESILNALRNTE